MQAFPPQFSTDNMAYSVQQDLNAKFQAALGQRFGTDNVNKGLDAMGKEAVQIMRNRTLAGLDVNGKPFDKYTAKYETWKTRYIRGKIKWGIRGGKPKPVGLAYRAKRMPDFMRLSGELFDDMTYSITKQTRFVGNSIAMKFRLFIKSRSAGKAEGLMKKREFFGIAMSGGLKLKEHNLLFLAFKRGAKIKGTGTLS